MRLLVTGASGFVGRRLVQVARVRWPGAEVIALMGPGESGGLDIADAASVDRAIAHAKPTHVVHLAAVAAVTEATRAPRAAFSVNVDGTLNLVEAIKARSPGAFLLHVSSAEVYGRSLNAADGAAVDEEALLQPVNAYAASKAAADLLVRAEAAQGLRAVVARPFNHVGAGQSRAFVAPAFAAQIACIEAGMQDPVIQVGNLDDARDFLSLDDVIDAYAAIIANSDGEESGSVYNIASGRPVRIREVLEQLLAASQLRIRVEVDPKRLRPGAHSSYVGDASKLRRRFGWSPRRPLAEALAAVLAEQRLKLARP